MEQLTFAELAIIEESLKYSKLHFENYQGFPSYEYKRDKIQGVEAVLEKVRSLKKSKEK